MTMLKELLGVLVALVLLCLSVAIAVGVAYVFTPIVMEKPIDIEYAILLALITVTGMVFTCIVLQQHFKLYIISTLLYPVFMIFTVLSGISTAEYYSPGDEKSVLSTSLLICGGLTICIAIALWFHSFKNAIPFRK